MWRATGAAPARQLRAASTNSFSRSERTARDQARHRHPAQAADDDHIDEDAGSGRALLQRVAEEVDDQQQQRQLGSEMRVGDPHQRVVGGAAECPAAAPTATR